MIDTDNVKGKYCSKQELIFYFKACEEVERLQKEVERLQKEVSLLKNSYIALTGRGE